jgi:hypothetical protein
MKGRTDRSPQRWLIAGVAGCLALLFGSVSVAAQPASTHRLRGLRLADRSDYAPDPGVRLHRLSESFVAQTLGANYLPAGIVTPPTSQVVLGGGLTAIFPTLTSPVLRCVNGHQTEDPLSPTCVARFAGDNGGATWRGVTGNEVRVLVYLYPSGPYPCDPSSPACGLYPRYGTYADLWSPPSATDDPQLTALRLLQTYFNRRYETYGRRVHLFAYFADPSQTDTLMERYTEEADENRLVINPFIVVRRERSGFSTLPPAAASDVYQEELARHQIVSIEGNSFATKTLGEAFPGLIWSYLPSLEQMADLFGSYVCQKVVNKPVVLSGNPGDNGKPRRLALLHVTGAGYEKYAVLASLVRQRIEACGGRIDAEVSYPIGDAYCDGESFTPLPGTADGSTDPEQQFTKLRAQGITTLLWPGCIIDRQTIASVSWLPEWVLLDTGLSNSNTVSNQAEVGLEGPAAHIIAVTPRPVTPPLEQAICAHAMADVDPHGAAASSYAVGCAFYPLLRQLFTAIQVAGPRLTPENLAASALQQPATTTSPPQAPPCRYSPGDFSCLRDAEVELWDGGQVDPSGEVPIVYPRFASTGNDRSAVGCFRSIDGGRRYGPYQWPAGNINAQVKPTDQCNDPNQIDD